MYRTIHPGVLKNLISVGKIGRDSRVLELSCGTGNYAGALSKFTDCKSYGIDPSQEMLSAAKKRFPSLFFRIGHAEKLDFHSDSFDLVFSVDVVHRVKDLLAGFRETYRILKNGGNLCTATESGWMLRHSNPNPFTSMKQLPWS